MMGDKYSGMTVNERLYVSGRLTDFDQAVENNDVEKVIAILKEIEIENESIKFILKKYGFE